MKIMNYCVTLETSIHGLKHTALLVIPKIYIYIYINVTYYAQYAKAYNEQHANRNKLCTM